MRFQPRDFDIFQSLEQHFQLIRQAAATLTLAIEGAVDVKTAALTLQRLERDGDESLRGAIRQLDRQMIDFPPREDIRRIFHYQDRILDAAEHIAGLLAAYPFGPLPDKAARLAKLVESCVEVLAQALHSFGASQRFALLVGRMVDLENEADQLLLETFRGLAEQENDPRRFFMLHELCRRFDELIDLFEDCVQIMEDSALKHAPGA